MESLRTGEVARRAGVNVETLRFYERRGILPEPPRRESGYREYPPETVDLIRFVKRAQELGFSLEEIRELLDLRDGPRRRTGKAARLVKSKVAEIEHKIHDLEAMREALAGLLSACERKGTRASCPIIESLSGCRPPHGYVSCETELTATVAESPGPSAEIPPFANSLGEKIAPSSP